VTKEALWEDQSNYYLSSTLQCRGCGSLLAAKLILRTVYEARPNAMIFGRSCGAGRSELQTGGRIGVDGSGMMGIEAAMKARGVLDEKTLVCMSGDGRALEMGSGDFISSFDREQRLTWIILDNQAYANSGSAANAMTPLKASTRIFSRASGGKPTSERDMPLMMLFSKARYVATASPAYVKDLVTKVREALAVQPSYLHVYTPCQVSWMYQPEQVVELSRRMVQSGLTPLWSYQDEVFTRTVKVSEKKQRPVKDFVSLQRRFEGVTDQDIEEIQALIEKKNRIVDSLESCFTEAEG
jgi:pyruvate/2-oxoacid:ferredoxin oxidoreductase beta subunit